MNWFRWIFLSDLREGADVERAIATIREGIRIRGYQTWIMLASALLACIGLDVSSPAVIIGAMLISPLMNPIVGIGLGLGINDRDLLLDALRNFGLAVAGSLFAAWIYFELTPLGDITTELSARTRPTLLDAAVAFVGGVAGILATSRKGITNAIPGVAIATALMPPLCTAGYGLAVGRWDFFLGAWYLFFLNAVLISTATYLMVQILRFPHVVVPETHARRRTRFYIASAVVLVLLPSGYILFRLLQENRARRSAEGFVTTWLAQTQREAIQQRLEVNDSIAHMHVYFIGATLPADSTQLLQARLRAVTGRNDMILSLVQLDVGDTTSRRIRDEITIDVLRRLHLPPGVVQVDSAVTTEPMPPGVDTTLLRQVAKETMAAFPEARSVQIGRVLAPAGVRPQLQAIALVDWATGVPARQVTAIKINLQRFLRQRLQDTTVVVVPR